MISSIQLSFFLLMLIEPILGTAKIIQIPGAILGENPYSLVTLDMRKNFKVENDKTALKISHKMMEI